MNDYRELIEAAIFYKPVFGASPVGIVYNDLINAIEQLIEQRDILEAVNQGLTEADDEIIKGLQIDLVKTAKIRDYLGRKYGDCASCCAFNCDKRDKSNNAPCGDWESVE